MSKVPASSVAAICTAPSAVPVSDKSLASTSTETVSRRRYSSDSHSPILLRCANCLAMI